MTALDDAPTTGRTHDPLTGRVVVVTGASSGIGAATAAGLVRAGATVVAVDSAPATVHGVIPQTVDLRDESQTASIVDGVLDVHGRLDALVNNAGLARHAGVRDLDLQDLDLMWQVNVRAVVQLTRDAMRAMAVAPWGQGDGGRVVNVISTAALTGQPGESAYGATKFAVRGFTEAASEEGRLLGVRVSGLYPAGVDTAFWDRAVSDRRAFTGNKTWLTPDSVAATVLSLLRLPADIDVPVLVIRHPGDTDLPGMADKLTSIGASR